MRLGVTVLTGVPITSGLDEAPVRLAVGQVIGADLVLDATGGRPNTGFLRPGLGDSLDAAGRVIVEATLLVRGHPSLYAIGDLVASDEPKTAIVAVAHARVTVRVGCEGRFGVSRPASRSPARNRTSEGVRSPCARSQVRTRASGAATRRHRVACHP